MPLIGIAGVAGVIALLALLSLATQWLWNALVPELFHGPTLTFLQAFGLLVLSRLLLRGGGSWGHARGWQRDRWRRRFKARLEAMTPEEREHFRRKWGSCAAPSEPNKDPGMV